MKKTYLLFFGFSLLLTAKAEKADGSASNFADGNVPAWNLSDPAGTGAVLTPSEDGKTATLSVSADNTTAGDITVTMTGEGDATPGVDTLSATVTITVKAAEATQAEIEVGEMTANA